MEYVRALVAAYANYCASTREAIETADQAGDMGTSDLFTEISRDADKNLYVLESHLQA
jgi:starvation-inducible DNA-binding protein